MKNKINSYIEIVVNSKNIRSGSNDLSVGVYLDENRLLTILRSRYEKVQISIVETRKDLECLVLKKPDLVFSGIKYFDFSIGSTSKIERLWLSDYLERHNIAYIGSNRAALCNENDKVLAKNIVAKVGVDTAKFFVAKPGDTALSAKIPIKFPVFIKPISGGGSEGVDGYSLADSYWELHKKVIDLYSQHNMYSLVEEFLPGAEYTVGILEDKSSNTITSMPIEITIPGSRSRRKILDLDVKKNNTELLKPVNNPVIRAKLSKLAIKAFIALGGNSHGRIDIKMSDSKKPYFIEANLIPGLGFSEGTERGYFYNTCLINQNMTVDQMILRLVSNGLSSK